MRYLEAQPSLRLADVIKCYWSLEQTSLGDPGEPEPVVPDGRMEIIYNLSDRFQRSHDDGSVELQPQNIIAGQMRRSVLIGPSGSVRLLGIRFRPAGARAFFRFPLSELTDRIEPLDTVWRTGSDNISERLMEAASFNEQVTIVESELLLHLDQQRVRADLMAVVACAIERGGGSERTKDLAKKIGYSERRLERRFKESVGLSAKTFSRIVRFQNVLKALEVGKGVDLLDSSLTHGYFDQSHMIHEFKEFTGKSPLTFVAEAHRMSELFTGAA